MNEEYFRELKAIVMTAIKEAIAGEISDEDNAESTAEFILRCGYCKKRDIKSEVEAKEAKFLEELPEFLHIKMEEINNNDDITTPFCVALANAITAYLKWEK